MNTLERRGVIVREAFALLRRGGPRPGWSQDALCPQIDTEVHLDDEGGSLALARAICALCTVPSECLADALSRDERFGIRGGVSMNRLHRSLGARGLAKEMTR